MDTRTFAILAALTTSGPVWASGGLMPNLSEVLGEAYEAPRELSDRAKPGAIIQLTDQGYQGIIADCVDAPVTKNAFTDVSTQSSLGGGVRVSIGAAQASAKAKLTLKLSFQDTQIHGFQAVDFVPSPTCITQLEKLSRRQPLQGMVLVQEVLMAKISACKVAEKSGSLGIPIFGGPKVEVSDECAMFSKDPVAVGVRTMKVTDIPEFARFATAHTVASPMKAYAVTPRDSTLLTDAVRASVHQYANGMATLLTRENMATYAKDKGLDLAAVPGADAVGTGRNIGADYVVVGDVRELEGQFACTLKIFSTKQGVLISHTQFRGDTVLSLVDQVPPVMTQQMSRLLDQLRSSGRSKRRGKSLPRIAVLDLRVD